MFNERQKERFINNVENTSTVRLYREWLFELIEKFEIKFKKDAYDFQCENIIYMYKLMNTSNAGTLRTINSLLTQYTRWAVQEGLTKVTQNDYMLIDYDTINSCLNKTSVELKFVTKEEFVNAVSQLINPREQFIMMALFDYGGSTSKYLDIGMQKLEDIDFNNHIMKLYSGRIVKISRELEKYAKKSVEEDKLYVNLNPNVRSYSVEYMTKKLYNNGTIIKSTSPDLFDKAKITRNTYSQSKRILDEIGLGHCSTANIVDSGKVYFMKEEMKQLNIQDFKQYLSVPGVKERIENQFGCSKVIIKRYATKYGGLI